MDNAFKILLPTAYFGPISYYAAIADCEKVVIETKETYCKQSIRNRCKVMTANGVLNLTLPVQKPNGNQSRTEEINIFNNEKWCVIHWRTIESAYSASPFFLYYRDELYDFFIETNLSLTDFNMRILDKILKIIGLSTKICHSKSFLKPENIDKNTALDLRFSFKKDTFQNMSFPSYIQVFSDRHGFQPDLSILDLLFNLGPETLDYLRTVAKSFRKN